MKRRTQPLLAFPKRPSTTAFSHARPRIRLTIIPGYYNLTEMNSVHVQTSNEFLYFIQQNLCSRLNDSVERHKFCSSSTLISDVKQFFLRLNKMKDEGIRYNVSNCNVNMYLLCNLFFLFEIKYLLRHPRPNEIIVQCVTFNTKAARYFHNFQEQKLDYCTVMEFYEIHFLKFSTQLTISCKDSQFCGLSNIYSNNYS